MTAVPCEPGPNPSGPNLFGRVTIILVNWNGWSDSIACIESCLALDYPAFRILLCDNDSGDGSVEKILAWAKGEGEVARDPASPVPVEAPRRPRGVALLDRKAAERGEDGDGAELLIIRTGGNLGFAGGNNVGLRWAMAQGSDWCWLLNNDTVVPRDALAHLVKCAAGDPRIGLCGSTLMEYGAPDRVQAYAGAIDLRNFRGRHLGAGHPLANLDQAILDDPVRPQELLYPIGASILVSADFLASTGLMEESYFLYYEEADWVIRAGAQFRVAIARDSLVYHKHGASAGSTSDGRSARSTAFLYRSRLLIARRLAPGQMPQVVLSILSEAARSLLRGRKGRVIGAWRALLGLVRVPTPSKEASA